MTSDHPPRHAGLDWRWLVGLGIGLLGIAATFVTGWVQPERFAWWPWRPPLPYVADWSQGLDGWIPIRPATGVWAPWYGELTNATDTGLELLWNTGADPVCLDGTNLGRINTPHGPGVDDYTVVAHIRLTPCPSTAGEDVNAGIVVRDGWYILVGQVSDPTGMYRGMHFAVDAPQGGFHVRQTYPLALPGDSPSWDQPHEWRIDVKGQRIQAFLDGTSYIIADDPTFVVGGEVGLVYQNMRLDVSDFRMEAN